MATRRRRALSSDPLEVVNRFVDSANRHDADAVAACVHRDFESIQPIHPVRNFRGSAQLLANWRTIFRTEPGFRLTVLRSAVDGDTVWVELHGAGQHAEVAGVFIIGVDNGLIRWARVYSELIEPAPEPVIPEPLAATVTAEADVDGGDAEATPADDEAGAEAMPTLHVVEDGEQAEEAAEAGEIVEAAPPAEEAEAAAEEVTIEPAEAVEEAAPAAAEVARAAPSERESVEIQAAIDEVRATIEAVEASEPVGAIDEPAGPTQSLEALVAPEAPQERSEGALTASVGPDEEVEESAGAVEEQPEPGEEAKVTEPPPAESPISDQLTTETEVVETLEVPSPEPEPSGWRRLLGRGRRGQP